MSEFELFDIIRIKKEVSGTSECEDKEVAFPAGTEGVIVDKTDNGYYIIDISWITSPVSEDGLLVGLLPDEMELVKRHP